MKKVNNYRPVQIPVGAYELLKEYCEMSGMKMGKLMGKLIHTHLIMPKVGKRLPVSQS